MRNILIGFLALAFHLGAAGPAAAPATGSSGITFRDITAAAGIRFTHNNGAFGKKYLPETMGPGVAFIDYDGDGWPDIFLVNGMDWPGHEAKHSTPKLYHNNHDGTFTDVTHKAGLDVEMFGMGVAVGDFDNDGWDDLFVTAYGQNRLLHNNGNGTFTDVTQKAGLMGPKEFSTGAAWVDYDKDGKLDLVVANYVQWSIEEDLYCTLDGKSKSYCTPESYKGTASKLYHNLGGGKFEDVTAKAGLADPTSKSPGAALGTITALPSSRPTPNGPNVIVVISTCAIDSSVRATPHARRSKRTRGVFNFIGSAGRIPGPRAGVAVHTGRAL